MSRALIVLHRQSDRDKACKWAQGIPWGSRIVFHEPKRTLPQNDALWSALGDIAKQKTHHGMKLEPEDWKVLFMAGLNQEMRVVPNLEGTGFIPLGRSSSKLSVVEMSGLLDIIHAWGALEGVVFSDGQG